MPDVILDSITGDLPAHCILTSGRDAIRQRVEVRLRTVLGEWFLDRAAGLPWSTWLGSKTTPPEVISARVRSEVAGTPGVTAVTSWTFEATRAGAITMDGEFRIEAEEEEPAGTIPIRVTLTSQNSSIGVIWFPIMAR